MFHLICIVLKLFHKNNVGTIVLCIYYIHYRIIIEIVLILLHRYLYLHFFHNDLFSVVLFIFYFKMSTILQLSFSNIKIYDHHM